MRKKIVKMCVLIMMTSVCYGAAKPKAPAGRSQGERSAVFRADQVLPKEILQGPSYRITGRVEVEEYKYVFKVKSDFGEFTARGRDMLGLRLRELKSIEAAKVLAKDPHAVDGILAPLKDTGKGLGLLITEPLETLGRVPKGFGLMVNQYLDPSDRRAGSLERRKLAVDLDCDPETTNPVLKKLLDDMSLKHGVGSLLTKAAMTFVPGLGLIPATAEMKEVIANNPPSEINKRIDKELEAAGVEKSLRSRFRKSAMFTTMQRLQLMEQFRALNGISGRAALIEAAAHAYSEAEALSVIREGKMLADLRLTKPILRLEFVGLPLAVFNNGTHVFVCSYDYVTNTQALVDGVSAFRASKPLVRTVLLTSGGVSAAATKTLESARVEIVEEGTRDW
ncbi:MAG: hypothetical protein ACYSWQ_03105 [Planctomycetota bacterium]|jgi:hypothetical protein